jgi:2',3'-cyclic-nucleotide 2'-phosphodiesterase (5'-nucleotidase family)
VTRTSAEALPVGPEYGVSEPLRDCLKDDLEKAEAHLDEVIGTAGCDLSASTALPAQSAVQQFIASAIAKAARADVVLHGLLTEEPLAAGPIHRSDIWRVVPYENRIGVVSLTPQELREVLEENAEQAGSIHFLGAYGISYDLCPGMPRGERISHLALADGSKPHPRKRLRVAFSSYSLASGGGRFPTLRRIAEQPTSRLRLTNIDTRSALVEYVRKHSPVCVSGGDGVRVVRGPAK